MPSRRGLLIWAVLGLAIAIPIALAAFSPQLAWRHPIYIASGFAGMAAMALLLLQPLLAGGTLPGLSMRPGRQVHRWVGIALVAAVIAHVGGLWLTSPPDVIDALLFESPTPFSVWGVVAMWTVFISATLALLRGRLRLSPRAWRLGHTALALIIVIGSVVHALLIEGTMEPLTKVAFCVLVLAATAKVVADLRVWVLIVRRKREVG